MEWLLRMDVSTYRKWTVRSIAFQGVNFDRKSKLEFHGVKVTGDVGLFKLVISCEQILFDLLHWRRVFKQVQLLSRVE